MRDGGILIVDDTTESLKLLAETLSSEHFVVRAAVNGEQALQVIAAEPPELIILDIRMPGMDGFEVCRRLKDNEGTREIPVLFLSAETDPEERVRGFALGGVDFIPKPFQREELLARVRTHLALSRLQRRLALTVKERTAELMAANKDLELELKRRKIAEEEIRKSLREKEVLIQEIYHRTNNNMQIIIALLIMYSDRVEDAHSKNIMKEMADRISAMSLVHQKLYESDDLSRIDLKNYILGLSAFMKQEFGAPGAAINIEYKLESGIVVLLETAIPIALALFELLSNVFKHAFRGGGGTIRMGLGKSEDNTIRIVVEDNGSGLPADFNPHRDGGMGLNTVASLVESQLRGKVALSSGGPGTVWTISFKDTLYKARI